MKLFFLSILLLTNLITFAQTKTTPSQQVDKIIAAYNKPNKPGLAISIVKDDRVVYKKGVGMANLEYNIPITPSTVFHVASVSKQFTAFSILLLEQEGKLSIDDDIRKYLTELPDFGHKISLRHLMTHTSGFRDIFDLTNLLGIRNEDMMSNYQMVEILLKQKGINFTPGEKFQYCNSGYILLAEIVKRVSGKSFAEFTSERIFKPLGMKHSFFLDDPETIVKNKAYSYYQLDNTMYKMILNFSFVGSTSLNTTVEDLAIWTQNFEHPKIGNDKIFNKMKERAVLNNGEILSYALGQEFKEYKGLPVIFHGGGDAGYRSYLLRIPDFHFAIAVASNDEKFNPLDIVYDIIDCYLKDKETNIRMEERITKLNPEILASLDGDYDVYPGFMITILHDENHLYLQTKGDTSKLVLPPISNYEFIYTARPHSRIVFHPRTDKKVNKITWHFSDFAYPANRIELNPFDQSKIHMEDFVGNYFNAEMNTVYKLVIQNNQLVALHNRNYDINLNMLQPDVFVSSISFFGKLEFIRNEKQQITGFNLSGQNSNGLKFDKID